MDLLKFIPFESCIDPSFWHKFSNLKLDIDKLSETKRSIWGYYSPMNLSILNIDCASLNKDFDVSSNRSKAQGYHFNLNTFDSFKECDRLKMLKQYGQQLKDEIESGEAVGLPFMLTKFILVTFADLKRHYFYYWFAFPAPVNPYSYLTNALRPLHSVLTENQVNLLFKSHKEEINNVDQQGFFGLSIEEDSVQIYTLKDFIQIVKEGYSESTHYWGFVDSTDDMEHPGWPLRNFLYLIFLQCPNLRKSVLSILGLRRQHNSIVMNVVFDENELPKEEKWTGSEKGHFRKADLSSNMDPIGLIQESVDLNLRLMKWRLVPDLNLDILKETRCLVLGAGTLGCAVARNLLAWGVKTVNFVDNGTVSYSNPVRQSLFTFEDCKEGNVLKAQSAANALKKIYPLVDSKGFVMTIPMPGRGVDYMGSCTLLDTQIEQHDVVFLVTDTRESRWLPTLLSTRHNKMAITAALGFDSYLVMRHGSTLSSSPLGCYFCNDVTAPGNSGVDRTLDQQCTVTRPGVAQIAAALAVEMMVSLLQHQLAGALDTGTATCLGEVPHSIRGFLTSHSQILPSTPAFSQCTACSKKVVDEFVSRGEDFLKNVFERASYLEDLTGLTELHRSTIIAIESAEIMELSSGEEDS